LSAVAFSSYELITYHRRIIKDISSTAVVVAAGCKEPLISRRAVDAQRVLLALRANPNVTAAGLYDRDGDLLARYPPNWSIGSFPLLPENGSYRIENGSLILFEPISGPDRILGTLYIRSDLVPYYAQLRSYALIVAAILAASFVISLWLADAMQKHITEPLLELVSTARIISERGDFTVRARRISGGEIGLLTDGFNRMLQRIQAQGEVEKRSEELRSFLAAIVESSDEGIIGKDLNGVVVSWNAGATRTFGYTAAEMIGRSVTMLLPAEHVADEDEILRGARRGEIQHYETVRVRKNGEQFPVSLTISPIQNAKGEVIGVSSISRDITQRRRAEEEIKRMNAELETRVRERTAELSHANAEVEAFAYSVAHDSEGSLAAH
jgi:PAS domain S-box-containing protein